MVNDKNKRILIATGIYPPSIGGPASYSKLLVDSFGPYGYDLAVLSFDSVRALPKGISHLVYFIKLFLMSLRADVIYAQDPVSVGFPTALVSFLSRKPYVLRLGGDYAWEQAVFRFGNNQTLDDFVMTRQKSMFVRLLQWIQTFVANHAKRVVVPSKYLKGIVREWGVKESHIEVIYNAFEVPQIGPKKAKEGDFTSIISVGRLVPWKGFSELVEVVSDLVSEGELVRLSIVGEGPQKGELERLIKEKDAGSFVTLTGALSRDDLVSCMTDFDMFVLFTGYEGFSHMILESMFLSVPVITTRVGGNTEIIEHAKNGILIEKNKSELKREILSLVRDPEKRAYLSTQAKKDVSLFTEKKMLTELDILFKTLI